MNGYHFIQNKTNTSDTILEVIELRKSRLKEDKEFAVKYKAEFTMDLLCDRIHREELELIEIQEDLKRKLEEESSLQTNEGLKQPKSNVTFMLAKMQNLIERI
jgi:hypothetical protein